MQTNKRTDTNSRGLQPTRQQFYLQATSISIHTPGVRKLQVTSISIHTPGVRKLRLARYILYLFAVAVAFAHLATKANPNDLKYRTKIKPNLILLK